MFYRCASYPLYVQPPPARVGTPAKLCTRFGPWLSFTELLRHFVHFSPFYWGGGGRKYLDFALIFYTSHMRGCSGLETKLEQAEDKTFLHVGC